MLCLSFCVLGSKQKTTAIRLRSLQCMGLQLLLALVETDAYYRGITASAHPNPSAIIPHFSLSHSSIPIVCPTQIYVISRLREKLGEPGSGGVHQGTGANEKGDGESFLRLRFD